MLLFYIRFIFKYVSFLNLLFLNILHFNFSVAGVGASKKIWAMMHGGNSPTHWSDRCIEVADQWSDRRTEVTDAWKLLTDALKWPTISLRCDRRTEVTYAQKWPTHWSDRRTEVTADSLKWPTHWSDLHNIAAEATMFHICEEPSREGVSCLVISWGSESSDRLVR